MTEAEVIDGHNVTSHPSVLNNIENAGGKWHSSEVVCDKALVTSRNPDDLPVFCAKLIEEIAEGSNVRARREPQMCDPATAHLFKPAGIGH